MRSSSCKFCSKPFPYRANKKFCSERCRWFAWINGAGNTEIVVPCVYCGVPADSIDHVPPRCVRPFLVEGNVKRWPFHEVSSCRECNSLLGNRPLWTVPERKIFIKAALKKKYARFLRAPVWAQEEISELGPNLRSAVHAASIIASVTRRRLAW